MGKILKKGKVVILLSGRHAGKKAIIVKTFEEGTKKQKFPCALVAGMREGPRRVTRSMGKKKTEKNVSKIKPFIKFVNYNHIMPTRYTVSDIDLRTHVTPANMTKLDKNEESRKEIKKLFEGRYLQRGKNTSGVQYFFHKLRF